MMAVPISMLDGLMNVLTRMANTPENGPYGYGGMITPNGQDLVDALTQQCMIIMLNEMLEDESDTLYGNDT